MKPFAFFSNLLLATVFCFAAIPKLADPASFAVVIGGYGIVPDHLVSTAAVFIPLWELATAGGLLLRHRWAYPSAAVMLTLFILVLSYGISRGLAVDCGCFGADDPEQAAYASLEIARTRDLLLLIPLFFSWWFTRPSSDKEHVPKILEDE